MGGGGEIGEGLDEGYERVGVRGGGGVEAEGVERHFEFGMEGAEMVCEGRET